MSFLTQTRLGNDTQSQTQSDLQSAAQTGYMLESFYAKECNMRTPIEFATNQVNVHFTAAGGSGNQCGIGGCNIDDNSSMLIGSTQTHPKARVSLLQRPYLTVPYLGRGPYDSMIETQLQQTQTFTNNKKSVNALSEISYIPLTNYPLIDQIKETVTNPTYLVEDSAKSGWVRGGLNTRKQ